MRRILSIGTGALLSLCAQAAIAGPTLVVEATGNYWKTMAGAWNPNAASGMSQEEFARGEFIHAMKFDLDSCRISNIGGLSGICTRFQDIISLPAFGFNFNSTWATLTSGSSSFSVSKTGVSAWVDGNYIDKPMPVNFEYPEIWGIYLNGGIVGNWVPQFNQLADVYGQEIQVRQEDYPFGSMNIYNFEDNIGLDIFESGFEYAKVYVVPEPNSLVLMGLAMAGLTFARRRKV